RGMVLLSHQEMQSDLGDPARRHPKPRQPILRQHGQFRMSLDVADISNWSSASAGVFQASVFRGLALRAAATAAMSSALCMLRSVPFGKYWRSSPLVFSLVPRCHGL